MLIWFCSSDIVSWLSTILKTCEAQKNLHIVHSLTLKNVTFEVVVYDLRENCSPSGLDLQLLKISAVSFAFSYLNLQQLNKLPKDSYIRLSNMKLTRVEKVWRSKSVKTNLCEWNFPPHLQYVAEADICKLWQFWQENETLTHCNSNTYCNYTCKSTQTPDFPAGTQGRALSHAFEQC